MDTAILKAVVTVLRAAGYQANVEYPGYISLGKRSYGTANGTWGWSDDDGNGGETDLDGNCLRSDLIAQEIIKNERYFAGAPIPTKAYGSDQEYLDDVCSELLKLNHHATVFHTGGGIYNLVVRVSPRVELYFGMADMNWAADVYVDDEFVEGASLTSDELINENLPGNSAVHISRIAIRFACEQMSVILENLDKKAKREAAERGFREAVCQFTDAANFVNRMWDSLPEESEYREIPCKSYPFAESFEEVAYKIGQWSIAVSKD